MMMMMMMTSVFITNHLSQQSKPSGDVGLTLFAEVCPV